jgi:triosephosphate isomerase
VDIFDGSIKTGTTSLTAVKAAGAAGLLINHSESRRTGIVTSDEILESSIVGGHIAIDTPVSSWTS